jgi:RimJ/RimL family protein N-acetyltransferase
MDRMLVDVPLELGTPRLSVRCYRAGDGPALHAAASRNRSHLARFEAGNILLTADTEERGEILSRELHAQWVSRDGFFAGAFLRETGDFVGQVYLGPVDWEVPQFEVGYIADRQHEGKGFVTEAVTAILGMAFDHMGAHRVSLRTDETNTRSQLVAQRCGFVLEGQLRHAHRHGDGSFTNELLYGLLRDEYAQGGGAPIRPQHRDA